MDCKGVNPSKLSGERQVLDSDGVGIDLAKEARNTTVFDLLKKTRQLFPATSKSKKQTTRLPASSIMHRKALAQKPTPA
jgi:hypothetical protein